MKQLLVLRDETYREGSPTNPVTIGSITELIRGAVAITADGNAIYDSGAVDPTLPESKAINFTVGVTPSEGETTKVQTSVPVPRRGVTNITFQSHIEGQVPVYTIGGGSTPVTLLDEGFAEVVVKNLSYNHVVSSQSVRVAETKHVNETKEAFLDRVVAALNGVSTYPGNVNVQKFFVAAKVGTTVADFGITLTALNPHVDFGINLGGMFELNSLVKTQEAIIPVGEGKDIVRLERDLSGNVGNGGYEKLQDLWFTQPIEAEAGTNYDVFSIIWDGQHGFPQQNQNVAENVLQIAAPTGSAIVAILKGAMANLFGNAYDAVAGAETGAEVQEDYTDNDPTT